MSREQATFEELQQDQARHWQAVQRQRQTRQHQVRDLMTQPWRCPSCGVGGLTDPICPRCRSARIVELE